RLSYLCSLLPTNYHKNFSRAGLPPGMMQQAVMAFENPVLLPQLRPELETVFSRYQYGAQLLDTSYRDVGRALLGGIRSIWVICAGLMLILSILNILLTSVPLRHGPPS